MKERSTMEGDTEMMKRFGLRGLGRRLVVGLTLGAMLLAACGENGAETSPDGETGGAPAEAARIAVFLAGSANTWWQAHLAGVQNVADEAGAEVTVFDGAYDAQGQYNQIQDAVTSESFDIFIVGAIDGGGLVPVVEEAIDAGIVVVAMGTVIGADLGTADPQVEGMAGSAVQVASEDGAAGAELVVQACEGIDPCQVAYLGATKLSAWDNTRREGFVGGLEGHPNIEIVIEGEGQWLPEPALGVAQDMIQAEPDLDVIATSGDQMTMSVVQAVQARDLQDQVKIVGSSSCNASWGAVKAGEIFGTTVTSPQTVGEAAAEMALAAFRGEPVEDNAFSDTSSSSIGRLLLQSNAEEFTPQYEC
jgi:ribose transport system substrate-binding protein